MEFKTVESQILQPEPGPICTVKCDASTQPDGGGGGGSGGFGCPLPLPYSCD